MKRLMVLLGLGMALPAHACGPQHAEALVVNGTAGPVVLVGRDGSRYRLAGLQAPPDDDGAMLARRLEGLAGRSVVVRRLDVADRYQRVMALVEVDGVSLGPSLIEEGVAAADAASLPPECRAAFVAAERRAITARAGFWGQNGRKMAATDRDALAAASGRVVAASGRVISVRTVRSTTYVNFGTRTDGALTGIVLKRDRTALQAGGVNIEALRGATITLVGRVEKRRGPQIRLTRPEQIHHEGVEPGAGNR